MKKAILVYSLILFTSINSFGQASSEYNSGLKVNLNEDGSKYFKITSWLQFQGIYTGNVAEDQSHFSTKLRRARVLLTSQFTNDFALVTQIGANNVDANNIGENSAMRLHDFHLVYNFNKEHSIGAGLHYYNGISRLNSSSTLNFLAIDGYRKSWPTFELSDHISRHIGIFAKGNFNKVHYRVSLNQANSNTSDIRDPNGNNEYIDESIYAGVKFLGTKKAGFNYAGYFEYQFFDQESHALPFKVDSYLGSKKVFNIGGGFFYHPNGSVLKTGLDNNGDAILVGQNVLISAVDIFYDSPIGERDAITFYASFQDNNMGKNFLFQSVGSGNTTYSQVGYLLPYRAGKASFQIFSAFGYNNYDAIDTKRIHQKYGGHIHLNGNNARISLEYEKESFIVDNEYITLQLMVYI